MANLYTEKSVGEKVYYRRMKDAFEPEDRNDELQPAIVLDVNADGEVLLRSPGVRGLLKPNWWCRWIDCFSGRDIVYRASNYTDISRLVAATPTTRGVYDWYQSGHFELFDILVNGIWGIDRNT